MVLGILIMGMLTGALSTLVAVSLVDPGIAALIAIYLVTGVSGCVMAAIPVATHLEDDLY